MPSLLGLALLCFSPIPAEVRPPNIVFVLVDDLGYGELGCYGNGFNETPRIDAFARKSLRFTDAHAMPVCSPTRASLMTGKFAAQTGINTWLGANAEPILDPAKEDALPKILSQAGYHTALIGKWHLDSHYRNRIGRPKAHGFQEVIATESKTIGAGDDFYPYDKIASIKTGTEGEFIVDRMTDEAVGVIRRAAQDPAKPFFLYLSHYAVHTVLSAPPKLIDKYEQKYRELHGEEARAEMMKKPGEQGHPDNPVMAAMLERIDTGFGRVLDTLDELHLSENTIVVFTSDNGGERKVANNGPMREGKATLYEGGLRVPQIVFYPGVTRAGLSHAPTFMADFYSTFAEVGGAKIPSRQSVDGVSLVPVLGGGDWAKPRTFFWHFAGVVGNPSQPGAGDAVREGDYKVVNQYRTGLYELFDLKTDPHETKDLAGKMPEKLADLKQKLEAWRKAMNIVVPLPGKQSGTDDDGVSLSRTLVDHLERHELNSKH